MVDVTKKMSADEYIEIIDNMVKEKWLANHPFLDRLDRGEISREQIDKIAYQMMFYYNNTLRSLGSVIASNMEFPARHALMENMIDEETEERCGYAAHYVIALDFAVACGYNKAAIEEANTKEELRAHPQLEDALLELGGLGLNVDPVMAMTSGMVGGEAMLPDLYIRMVQAMKKHYTFTDQELDIFIVHIEGDIEHSNEGRKLIKQYATTPEDRLAFYKICEYARDRLYEAWDGIFRSADLDLPQAVYPRQWAKAAE